MSHFDWWDKRNRQGTQPSPKPSSQTASPAQPGQHRSGQARPQPSPAQPKPDWDKGNRQGTQPSLSPAHKPQAQPSQASTGQARPGHSRAQPSPSLGVGLAKAVPKAFSYRIQIKPSPAQPRPAQPTTQARSAQPSSQTANPVQPGQHRSGQASTGQARPGQATAEPSPAQAVVWALPKLCQRLFLHSRPPERSVFVPFLAGLGPPCRCVSPFWSLGSGASFLAPAQPRPVSLAQPSPAQPSPAQPKPWCGPCQSSAKAFSYRTDRGRSPA